MPLEAPFTSDRPLDYIQKALENGRQLLGGQPGEVVSFKIRPIPKWPVDSPTQIHDAYVYPNEYSAIYEWLSRFPKTTEGFINGKAIGINADGRNQLLFVEHESGPEIILYLGVATAALGLAKSVVDLVTTIIKIVSQANEAKKAGTDAGRYYEAAAITIEKRTSKETTTIKVITLPIKEGDTDPQRLLDTLFKSIN